jgi:type I restriction enzyme R subunit
MAFTDINSEDRLVQKTCADHLHEMLGWDSVYAWNEETFGPEGTLGRLDQKDVVLTRDLRAAITRFDPELPDKAVNEAIEKLTRQDFSRSALQHNHEFYGHIRNGVPVSYRDAKGQVRQAFARVIDFRHPEDNRFLCVRELKITGLRTPNYNRRADLVCFVNGLPLVFIELKALYKNIRAGFDGNLRDYMDEHVIAHAFHYSAFLIVSNGDRARYGSITSEWDHFAEWKRQDEQEKGSVDAEVLLNGMLAKERLLKENHRYVFSLIHKFNQDVNPQEPYSERDDIIVISDEAHRTQAGRLARNMHLALPNAAFIGFTGTPLFKHDQLTKRIFGDYVSRYDFKRSEEDSATVKLVYENRGEKLGIARLDLNDRIAAKIEEAELDPDQEAQLEKLLGKDYEVITADDRLDKIANDFVEHCATRWEAGKSMLVCIGKVTCARVHQRIMPRWQVKAEAVRQVAEAKQEELAAATDPDARERLQAEHEHLRAQARWLDKTIIEIIISEAQNEVADFKKWDFEIIPHRARMKQGFETADGKRVDVETAFKNPEHPFRVAIISAMWLTGFDVECLSTLYIDKPMKAHTLMQAIARANRRYPGKDFGLIVDYNGMLKSLREALAQYALGDEGDGDEEIVAPIEERVQALIEAIEATEAHIRGLGFEMKILLGAQGFARIKGIADTVDAVYTSDETKRRFENLARQVFIRFKALLMEPAAFAYAECHDNIEAVYKKLTERRDTADVTELLKELHRIVNEAIRAQEPGDDQTEGLTFDLSRIDLKKLRDEFAKKVRRKATALQDIREIVEQKLAEMLKRNPQRMDYYKRYQEIVADYNREKDRATMEETFAKLVGLVESLDEEQRRAVEEGLNEDELALFDLLKKEKLGKVEREKVKQASQVLLASLHELLAPLECWTEKEQTQAEVETFILDNLYTHLPSPPFTEDDKQEAAKMVYQSVWQQSVSGEFRVTV